MAPASFSTLPADVQHPTGLLRLLLDTSLTGVMLLAPCYDAAGETITDFAWVSLNPAAQRQLGLPERPAESFLTLFPTAEEAGVFGFYREAFLAGEVARRQNIYQSDGLDGYFVLVAQRYEQVLLVNFTDTNNQPRTAVEEALRASQAREQAAHAAAEAQRQRLYDVLQHLPTQVATYQGPAHVYTFVNPSYQRYFPHQAQLVGRPIRQVLPGAVEQGVLALMDRVYQTGEPYQASELEVWLDFTGRGAPPRQVFLNLLFHPLRDAQGHLIGLLDFSCDVTEQVRARQQVEQLNQELEARVQERTRAALALQADVLAATQHQVQERDTFYQVFAQTPAAICIQRGPEHRYEYANQAYRDFFPGRLLIGQSVAEALPETVDSGVVALLDHVYQTGETYSGVELPLLMAQPTGPPRQMYFTFTYQAYREQGEIVGISTFAYDVAEQVLARRQREAQQEQLRDLFEQAPVAIAVFEGPEYVVEVANPRVAELWGRTPAQVVGRPLFEALPEINPAFRPLLDRVVQTGEAYVAQEVATPLLRDGGVETVYLNFVYEPLRDAATGAVTRVAAVATDVTGQVQDRLRVQQLNDALHASNAELAGTNAQLVRTNVDLDTFVYTASHDLKAPITNIESLSLALRATLPPEVQQQELVAHLLDLLDHTVARFQSTIAQLTDISRLQLAHAGPAEPVGLARVVEDVRLDLAPAIAAAGTQLTVEVAPELVVSFSPANLRSIVYNLLSNAIKYRDPARPSVVRVRAAPAAQALVLEVQDNGLGMSEVQQRQLFGLFQRLHTHVEGTGVGLYISKRLVENAGGTIAVQSQVAVGTTFTVTFPA